MIFTWSGVIDANAKCGMYVLTLWPLKWFKSASLPDDHVFLRIGSPNCQWVGQVVYVYEATSQKQMSYQEESTQTLEVPDSVLRDTWCLRRRYPAMTKCQLVPLELEIDTVMLWRERMDLVRSRFCQTEEFCDANPKRRGTITRAWLGIVVMFGR